MIHLMKLPNPNAFKYHIALKRHPMLIDQFEQLAITHPRW